MLLYLLVNYKNFLSQVESVLLLYVLCADDDDFSFETGMGSIVLTFTESEEQCINISIAMDNLLEASEHFSVVMGSRDDRVKLNNRISQIYIIDSGSEFMQPTHLYVYMYYITNIIIATWNQYPKAYINFGKYKSCTCKYNNNYSITYV